MLIRCSLSKSPKPRSSAPALFETTLRILSAQPEDGVNKVHGDSGEAETSNGDGGAVPYVSNGICRPLENLRHPRSSPTTTQNKPWATPATISAIRRRAGSVRAEGRNDAAGVGAIDIDQHIVREVKARNGPSPAPWWVGVRIGEVLVV